MYPILFEVGSIMLYSYGFMIALGIVAGMVYLIIQGRKELNTVLAQPAIAKVRQRKEGGGRKKNDKPS